MNTHYRLGSPAAMRLEPPLDPPEDSEYPVLDGDDIDEMWVEDAAEARLDFELSALGL